MAISPLIVGALKTSLKTAARKAVAKAATDQAASTLSKIATSKISDANAAILNRLKTAPNKILYDYVSSELGLPVSELRNLLNNFNQTPRQNELSKGQQFKEFANKALAKKIGGGSRSIKEIINRVNRYLDDTEKPSPSPKYNKQIQNRLKEIEEAVYQKFKGKDSRNNDIEFEIDVLQYYDDNTNYTLLNLNALNAILNSILNFAEDFSSDSTDDLVLVNIDSDWVKYNKRDIDKFIEDIIKVVRDALGAWL